MSGGELTLGTVLAQLEGKIAAQRVTREQIAQLT